MKCDLLSVEQIRFLKEFMQAAFSLNVTVLTDPEAEVSHEVDIFLREGLPNSSIHYRAIEEYFQVMPAKTFQMVYDPFMMYSISFRPSESDWTIITASPFLENFPDSRFFISLLELNHALDYSMVEKLKPFLYSLPVIENTQKIFDCLQIILKEFGIDASAFPVVFSDKTNTVVPKEEYVPGEQYTLDLQIIEENYRLEDQLMDAVGRGDHKAAFRFSKQLIENGAGGKALEKLRNVKNILFVVNTLFRKAAQWGDVHPYYIHQISSVFATEIEAQPTVASLYQLHEKMLHKYCMLVKNHSLKDYSAVIRSAVNFINICTDLSLPEVAERLNISTSYLSRQFKKEAGLSFTDYINQQRVQQALKILNTSQVSIQSVAEAVGIFDTNYFTKIFKKQIGKTPGEYKKMLQQK